MIKILKIPMKQRNMQSYYLNWIMISKKYYINLTFNHYNVGISNLLENILIIKNYIKKCFYAHDGLNEGFIFEKPINDIKDFIIIFYY